MSSWFTPKIPVATLRWPWPVTSHFSYLKSVRSSHLVNSFNLLSGCSIKMLQKIIDNLFIFLMEAQFFCFYLSSIGWQAFTGPIMANNDLWCFICSVWKQVISVTVLSNLHPSVKTKVLMFTSYVEFLTLMCQACSVPFKYIHPGSAALPPSGLLLEIPATDFISVPQITVPVIDFMFWMCPAHGISQSSSVLCFDVD